MSTINIDIHDDGPDMKIAPASFLGDDFRSYLGACRQAGATYNAKHRAQIIEPNRLASAITALREAGFEVSVHESLQTAVDSAKSQVKGRASEAYDRLAKLTKKFAARGLKLRPFQDDGVLWMNSRDSGVLGDEMGLGKTIQTLAALPENAPVIIIAPAAVKGVWQREFAIWRPEYRVEILSGRESFRWPLRGEALITNYAQGTRRRARNRRPDQGVRQPYQRVPSVGRNGHRHRDEGQVDRHARRQTGDGRLSRASQDEAG